MGEKEKYSEFYLFTKVCKLHIHSLYVALSEVMRHNCRWMVHTHEYLAYIYSSVAQSFHLSAFIFRWCFNLKFRLCMPVFFCFLSAERHEATYVGLRWALGHAPGQRPQHYIQLFYCLICGIMPALMKQLWDIRHIVTCVLNCIFLLCLFFM